MTETLKEQLLKELNRENMLQTIHIYSQLFRCSGSRDGEEAAGYLENQLRSYGIPFEHCEYDGFFSIPIEGSAEAFGKTFPILGDVYSEEADRLCGELFYDRQSAEKPGTELEEEHRFSAFRDKIVLTWDGKGEFAQKARKAGAKAVLHICATKGDYLHHSNIGTVWGTPGFDEAVYMQFLPSAGIRRSDGESLIRLLSASQFPAAASVTISMETRIQKSSMVIAEIPGQSKNFLLLSGHYDSWYEGITDNAVSDAILLEYARILWSRRRELCRSVRIAWWSGHSDGRFSGSAWYFDSHWKELRDRCIAHINLDLTGCRNSDQIVARTAFTEGLSFTGDLIKKYTRRKPSSYIPMIRGADQSFWGACVPITIMLKYEPTEENRLSDCPSGGPWWHTPQDTIDKLDQDIMMRDAKINLEMAADIANSPVLPISVQEFSADMTARLSSILSSLGTDFDGAEIWELWNRLCLHLDWLSGEISEKRASDEALKSTIGKLLHLIYCRLDPCRHDFGGGFGIFGALRRFSGLSQENSSKAYYTMAKSEFLRSKNRLCCGIKEITEYLEQMEKHPPVPS